MIHKLAHMSDITGLELSPKLEAVIKDYLDTYDTLYGEDRDVENDDGGYILYCDKGTSPMDVRMQFDYTEETCEYTQRIEGTEYMQALFILNNEYVVFIIMTEADMPKLLKQYLIRRDKQ